MSGPPIFLDCSGYNLGKGSHPYKIIVRVGYGNRLKITCRIAHGHRYGNAGIALHAPPKDLIEPWRGDHIITDVQKVFPLYVIRRHCEDQVACSRRAHIVRIVNFLHMRQSLAPCGGLRITAIVKCNQFITVAFCMGLNGVQALLSHPLIAVKQHDDRKIVSVFLSLLPLRQFSNLPDTVPLLNMPVLQRLLIYARIRKNSA